jgi:uncharacterized protein (TIGR02284 family)
METTMTEVTAILNDLVLINNDRIAGYEKALEELKQGENASNNSDLVTLFTGYISKSREYRNALGQEVQAAGGDMSEGTMTSGKIYRAWMDVKGVFGGRDRHGVLAWCEGGEDAAQKAYKAALDEEGLPSHLRDTISNQKNELRMAHDEVKALRDQSAK